MGILHKEKDKHQVHYHGEGLKNLVLGIGIGAALAWMFTTKEGVALRKKLVEEEGDIADKLKEFLSGMKNGASHIKEEILSEESESGPMVEETTRASEPASQEPDRVVVRETPAPGLSEHANTVDERRFEVDTAESGTPHEMPHRRASMDDLAWEIEEAPAENVGNKVEEHIEETVPSMIEVIPEEVAPVQTAEPSVDSNVEVIETSSPESYQRSNGHYDYGMRPRRFFRRIR